MKSQFKILPLIICIGLSVMSAVFLILEFKWFAHKDWTPVNVFLFFTFLNLIILALIAGLFEIKSFEIDNRRIKIKHLFGLYIYKYDFSEIEGFNKSQFKNKVGKYPILLIKTTSGRIFEINGFLISNTDSIERELIKEFVYNKTIISPMIGNKEKVIIVSLFCLLVSFIGFIVSHSN